MALLAVLHQEARPYRWVVLFLEGLFLLIKADRFWSLEKQLDTDELTNEVPNGERLNPNEGKRTEE